MYPYRDERAQGGGGPNSLPSFKAPPPTVYDKYLEHIDAALTGETPLAFGLHPNAEIGFRTEQATRMLSTIVSLQPNLADSSEGDEGEQHAADAVLNDVIDTFSEVRIDIADVLSNIDSPGPFQNVFLQECEVMNLLVKQMMKTLDEVSFVQNDFA